MVSHSIKDVFVTCLVHFCVFCQKNSYLRVMYDSSRYIYFSYMELTACAKDNDVPIPVSWFVLSEINRIINLYSHHSKYSL